MQAKQYGRDDYVGGGDGESDGRSGRKLRFANAQQQIPSSSPSFVPPNTPAPHHNFRRFNVGGGSYNSRDNTGMATSSSAQITSSGTASPALWHPGQLPEEASSDTYSGASLSGQSERQDCYLTTSPPSAPTIPSQRQSSSQQLFQNGVRSSLRVYSAPSGSSSLGPAGGGYSNGNNSSSSSSNGNRYYLNSNGSHPNVHAIASGQDQVSGSGVYNTNTYPGFTRDGAGGGGNDYNGLASSPSASASASLPASYRRKTVQDLERDAMREGERDEEKVERGAALRDRGEPAYASPHPESHGRTNYSHGPGSELYRFGGYMPGPAPLDGVAADGEATAAAATVGAGGGSAASGHAATPPSRSVRKHAGGQRGSSRPRRSSAPGTVPPSTDNGITSYQVGGRIDEDEERQGDALVKGQHLDGLAELDASTAPYTTSPTLPTTSARPRGKRGKRKGRSSSSSGVATTADGGGLRHAAISTLGAYLSPDQTSRYDKFLLSPISALSPDKGNGGGSHSNENSSSIDSIVSIINKSHQNANYGKGDAAAVVAAKVKVAELLQFWLTSSGVRGRIDHLVRATLAEAGLDKDSLRDASVPSNAAARQSERGSRKNSAKAQAEAAEGGKGKGRRGGESALHTAAPAEETDGAERDTNGFAIGTGTAGMLPSLTEHLTANGNGNGTRGGVAGGRETSPPTTATPVGVVRQAWGFDTSPTDGGHKGKNGGESANGDDSSPASSLSLPLSPAAVTARGGGPILSPKALVLEVKKKERRDEESEEEEGGKDQARRGGVAPTQGELATPQKTSNMAAAEGEKSPSSFPPLLQENSPGKAQEQQAKTAAAASPGRRKSREGESPEARARSPSQPRLPSPGPAPLPQPATPPKSEVTSSPAFTPKGHSTGPSASPATSSLLGAVAASPSSSTPPRNDRRENTEDEASSATAVSAAASYAAIPRFYYPLGRPTTKERVIHGPVARKLLENPHLKIADGLTLPGKVLDENEVGTHGPDAAVSALSSSGNSPNAVRKKSKSVNATSPLTSPNSSFGEDERNSHGGNDDASPHSEADNAKLAPMSTLRSLDEKHVYQYINKEFSKVPPFPKFNPHANHRVRLISGGNLLAGIGSGSGSSNSRLLRNSSSGLSLGGSSGGSGSSSMNPMATFLKQEQYYRNQLVQCMQRICLHCLGIPRYFAFVLLRLLYLDNKNSSSGSGGGGGSEGPQQHLLRRPSRSSSVGGRPGSAASIASNTNGSHGAPYPSSTAAVNPAGGHGPISAQQVREFYDAHLKGKDSFRRVFDLLILSSRLGARGGSQSTTPHDNSTAATVPAAAEGPGSDETNFAFQSVASTATPTSGRKPIRSGNNSTLSNSSTCNSANHGSGQPELLRSYLLAEDFTAYLNVLLQHHPGLSFLKQTPDFQAKYLDTVIYRIFYELDRLDRGHISFQEFVSSRLMDAFREVDATEDINAVLLFFSYEHFYVLYCRFWELDEDRDMLLSREDFSHYQPEDIMSPLIIDRIFKGVGRPIRCTVKDRIGYEDFVWYCLSEEDKSTPRAIRYWFRILDLDGDGVISVFELQTFYDATKDKIAEYVADGTIGFHDVVCQIFDMLRCDQYRGLYLSDFLREREAAAVALNMVTNVIRFLQFEQRDPFVAHQDRLLGGMEQSAWDRFARVEYDRMAQEVDT